MKKLFLNILFSCTVCGLINAQNNNSNNIEKQNDFSLIASNKLNELFKDKLESISNNKDFDLSIKSITPEELPASFEKKVLINELMLLFDPENFKCQYDKELIKKLQKLKNATGKDGYVPAIVTTRIKNQEVYKISNSGSNILAHSFRYIVKEKVGNNIQERKSDLIFCQYSPTVSNFNEADYIDRNAGGYNNFFYSLDCSGYLSTALSASGGIDAASVKTSAEGASNSSNSLIIVSGLMYSPLYRAYQGKGIFEKETIESLTLRSLVINSIISSVPNTDRKDDTVIKLDTNYKVVLTSNSGKSSFNGEASLSASGGIGFGFGSASTNNSAGGKINRSSEFSDYNTYLLASNVNAPPDTISILTLKNILIEINSKIATLPK